MTLCSECKHCAPHFSYFTGQFGIRVSTDWALSRCALTDVVLGNGTAGDFCTYERSEFGKCGPHATRFEAKPLPEPEITPVKRRRWWHWRTA